MQADFLSSSRNNWEHNERERSPLAQDFWYSSGMWRTFYSRTTCDLVQHTNHKDNCFQMEVLSRQEESYRINDVGICQIKEEKAHNSGMTLTFILNASRGGTVEVER